MLLHIFREDGGLVGRVQGVERRGRIVAKSSHDLVEVAATPYPQLLQDRRIPWDKLLVFASLSFFACML